MSKLSPSLKQLINAPFAKPGAIPAPKNIRRVFENVAQDAASKDVGTPAWLSIAVSIEQLQLVLMVNECVGWYIND